MSDLNVARLVPHNEQDALLAAACPLPDMVAGVGHVFHRGEYWLLIYESCGHDQYFRRTADGLYARRRRSRDTTAICHLRHLCVGADPCSVGKLDAAVALTPGHDQMPPVSPPGRVRRPRCG